MLNEDDTKRMAEFSKQGLQELVVEQETCEHGVVKKYCFRCKRPDLAGEAKSQVVMDTSKVTRVEVIDHTKIVEYGGGRAYTYWSEYSPLDAKKPKVELSIQDDGHTMKIFIS